MGPSHLCFQPSHISIFVTLLSPPSSRCPGYRQAQQAWRGCGGCGVAGWGQVALTVVQAAVGDVAERRCEGATLCGGATPCGERELQLGPRAPANENRGSGFRVSEVAQTSGTVFESANGFRADEVYSEAPRPPSPSLDSPEPCSPALPIPSRPPGRSRSGSALDSPEPCLPALPHTIEAPW